MSLLSSNNHYWSLADSHSYTRQVYRDRSPLPASWRHLKLIPLPCTQSPATIKLSSFCSLLLSPLFCWWSHCPLLFLFCHVSWSLWPNKHLCVLPPQPREEMKKILAVGAAASFSVLGLDTRIWKPRPVWYRQANQASPCFIIKKLRSRWGHLSGVTWPIR